MTNRSREPAEVHRFRVDDEPDDRLDAHLADRLRLSRNRVAELIDGGLVRVNGSPTRKSRRLRAGDEVEVTVPAAPPTAVASEPIRVEIVYEDDHLAVVDKRAGMVVHPAVGTSERHARERPASPSRNPLHDRRAQSPGDRSPAG